MSWLKKKADPISDRAQALNSEIASLEAQIKQLDEQLQRGPDQPRLRSTAVPHGATISRASANPPNLERPTPQAEPVFEEVNQEPIKVRTESITPPELFNDYGVRKYDFTVLVQRVRTFFQGPSTSNPKLVNYLAAGGVQGLQPLRKEARVARNRFILFAALLFVVLFGTLWWFLRTR